MALPQKTWLSKGGLIHKLSALLLSCRFEWMGKIHFPWSFPFLIWLSVKSVRGFAVLMLPGELQVLGAVFHQECSSAGDSGLSSAAAHQHQPTHSWNYFPQVLDCCGDLGLIPLEFSREFPLCGQKSQRGVQNITHVGFCSGHNRILAWIQRSLRVQDSSWKIILGIILGKKQPSLLHCLRKQCCEYM